MKSQPRFFIAWMALMCFGLYGFVFAVADEFQPANASPSNSHFLVLKIDKSGIDKAQAGLTSLRMLDLAACQNAGRWFEKRTAVSAYCVDESSGEVTKVK